MRTSSVCNALLLLLHSAFGGFLCFWCCMPGGIHHITLSPSRFGRRCRWSCKMGKSSENSFSCTASHIFLFFVFPALFDCFCVFFFLSDGFWSLTTFGGKRNSKKKKTLYGHPGCCFCSCFCSFRILSANDVPPPCYPFPPTAFPLFSRLFSMRQESVWLSGGRQVEKGARLVLAVWSQCKVAE